MKSIPSGKSALPLFEAWPGIAHRLRNANQLLLLLDFDGTLVGLKPRPEDVRLDQSLRQLLSRLARRPGISLGFISGRRRADLRRRVNVSGARYWGVHGWEDRAGKRLSRKTRKELLRAQKLLAERIVGLRGVWIEDKRASFVLHFREASPQDARRAHAAARFVLNSSTQLRMLAGKKVLELLPPEVKGKGATVEGLTEPPGTLVLYAGDDATDESVFVALRQGLTIHVGRSSRTHARYRVENPSEVREFLERLEAAV
ncbi:MAG: trehalose-phosphatase [Terriglobia bacterium]